MESQEKTGLGRREFIGAAAAALFAGVVIQITGCSTEDDSPAPADGDIVGTVTGAQHGHAAIVTKARIDAGGEVILDIQGSATHSHTVTLTAEDMAKLKTKTHVMHTSTSSNSHTHDVMFFA